MEFKAGQPTSKHYNTEDGTRTTLHKLIGNTN